MEGIGDGREGSSAGSRPARQRRADAQRNIEAILEAALDGFTDNQHTNMSTIARAAGVGRVTLYAHFSSREILLDAVLERAISQGGAAIEAAHPNDGPAAAALQRVLRSSWQVLATHRRLFEIARQELGPVRLRQHHDQAMTRIEQLLERGQKEGDFRTDLQLNWLVTLVYSLLHAAAEDVNTGRLEESDAARTVEATLLAALSGDR